jgi:hypothetical protein
MRYCPSCGAENPDQAQYCVACGKPLQPKTQPPRHTITEHLTYAVNTATHNLKIFLPHIAIYLLVIAFFTIFFLNIGFEYAYMGDFDPSTLPGGAVKLTMLFMLTMIIVGILSIPFLQHLYQSAIKQEPVSFTESAKYALSRFISYLGAELLVFVAMMIVMFIWFTQMPMEAIMNYPDIDYARLWTSWIWMIILIPPAVIYYIALNIMTWDDTGLITALKSSIAFIRSRLTMLLTLWIIMAIVNAIIIKIPLGALLSFVPSVIMDLTTIDIYTQYKKPAEEPTENPASHSI